MRATGNQCNEAHKGCNEAHKGRGRPLEMSVGGGWWF